MNRSYWITQNNGLLPEGNYTFGPDGKMEIERVITIEEIDGVLYCYRDGQPHYAGLFMLDGNYYYARSNRQLVVGCSYWVSRTNGLLPEGRYTFDETGKMIP